MDFKLDITNPQEVAAKMPQLQALYEQKLREQQTLNEQVELLRRLVGHASMVSRGHAYASEQEDRPPEPPRRRRAAPAQDHAVRALEHAYKELGGTALGPTSLYKYMVERNIKVPNNPAALGTNLWDAWKAGRIMRAPNGVYTPLDGTGNTEWDRPLTDYYYAAEQGFPTPSNWPPQLYRGIDHFITALQDTQETGRVVTFENGPHPGILVLIDGHAVGAVALEQGETRKMLSARIHELLS